MKKINPPEVQRIAVLALALEPLAEKKGCTTRTIDLHSNLKLVDFQAAAINAGLYFYTLAERIKKAHGQPKYFYDLCVRAIEDSTRNLENKKQINFGLLDLLFPLIISHVVYGGSGATICKNFVKVLKNSSSRDVVFKNKMRRAGWKTSRKSYKSRFPIDNSYGNLYDLYKRDITVSKEIGFESNVYWLGEFNSGLPTMRSMLEVAKKIVKKQGLLKALEKCYDYGMKKITRVGIAADYTAAIAYLLLVEPGSDTYIK